MNTTKKLTISAVLLALGLILPFFTGQIQEIGNTKVEFDIFKYNVSRLQNQPVSELKSMLSNELQGVTNEQ